MSYKEPLQLSDLPWDDVIFRHIFPLLKVADLCHLQGVSKDFQQLYIDYMCSCEKLDFSECTMTNSSLQKVTELCQNLRWFSVAWCPWVKDPPLIALFKKNSRLIHVDLCGCEGLNGLSLQSQLRHINTASCWDINDRTLGEFFHKCNKLRVIELNKMELITDTILHYLATNCPHLEHLNVASCWYITDKGLKKVVEYCKVLRILDVRFCPRLTEQYLYSLYLRGINVKSDYSLARMVKRRKHVNNLGINVQI
ncbi:F-box/LRR-repeat protein 15-like isoform X2 [Homarus americanus]|uniref:F-box/LRR-repeat protein 15-like isoform X2 n=1 Tax=Homarus americanus TaxID=6706 RepID=UPI001C446E84|nr:F-box/LRR-repeat protein 15-like isoform X2 [Homarus americanus]